MNTLSEVTSVCSYIKNDSNIINTFYAVTLRRGLRLGGSDSLLFSELYLLEMFGLGGKKHIIIIKACCIQFDYTIKDTKAAWENFVPVELIQETPSAARTRSSSQ